MAADLQTTLPDLLFLNLYKTFGLGSGRRTCESSSIESCLSLSEKNSCHQEQFQETFQILKMGILFQAPMNPLHLKQYHPKMHQGKNACQK